MQPLNRRTGSAVAAAMVAVIPVTSRPAVDDGSYVSARIPPLFRQHEAAGPIVSLDWLRKHNGTAGVVVIAAADERSEYERGHIPGARFLGHGETLLHQNHRFVPPGDLAKAFARAGATDNVRIVIYGEPMLVGWIYVGLASLGHGDHTSVLDGNVSAWRAAGHPVETGRVAPAAGTLTPRAASYVSVERAWVREHVDDSSTRLLDVRSPEEWSKGTIPKASPVKWQDFYADLQAGRFKPLPELRAVFERAGVGQGQTAVTYCAVGMRASLAYLAARAAGIPARVYIGSWADWTSDPKSPIARK
jgi:thiosulfate/3-mercaptopyruvate sulfurtransferase